MDRIYSVYRYIDIYVYMDVVHSFFCISIYDFLFSLRSLLPSPPLSLLYYLQIFEIKDASIRSQLVTEIFAFVILLLFFVFILVGFTTLSNSSPVSTQIYQIAPIVVIITSSPSSLFSLLFLFLFSFGLEYLVCDQFCYCLPGGWRSECTTLSEQL